MSFPIQKKDIYRSSNAISFPQEEERILSYWQNERIFEKGQTISKDKHQFTFYDGPPFATGLPHYGHILAGTIKDIVTRHAYQNGFHVERRFGWDCHGLPVENEVDKMLGIKSPKQVEEDGIARYNQMCGKIVMRYADEWRGIIGRMGRWIDFENDYKTLYPWYMETVWWIFKQLYEKGLVYHGVKVMPFCTHCGTPLSNFEAGQNYKQVTDPSIVVAFGVIDDKDNANLLISTTTPWTLPANLALCVNPNLFYVKVRSQKNGDYYILSESSLERVWKTPSSYEIVSRCQGQMLLGLRYKPIFPYFVSLRSRRNCFRVVLDEYVSPDQGTGIVHQAPYFGEDDYRVCLASGIISKSSEIICPVDDGGCFTDEVTDFKGKYIKTADKDIIQLLADKGVLFCTEEVSHSYPFCWRSDTPLIYKAVPSWFIRVEQMRPSLLECIAETYWVPKFVKSNRFGNWLEGAQDWAVSRNRFWGTPIPIWTSSNGDEIICVGSVEELEKLSGCKVTDLHRESVDHIEIPSTIKGKPPLRRIDQVFDCWFESGSMPFAQKHYPFENKINFLDCFPADFVAEGIDQTRGWFYTLLVISTALFNKAPFKNLIANGLVLASDGQKMSKRKKNYPDPMVIVKKFGADALRLYLINSPVVRADNLRFREEGVRDVVKDVLIPWYNAFRFLVQNINKLEEEAQIKYLYDSAENPVNREQLNLIDIWIISYKETLLNFISTEMQAYRLYTVVPRLVRFIGQLTNWYIRLNRRRFKGAFGKVDSLQSINVLFEVLSAVVKVMAPFTPFFSEYLYHRLALFEHIPKLESVHYEMMPKPNPHLINKQVENAVSGMQKVVELGRIIREQSALPLRHPVQEVIVVHRESSFLEDIRRFQNFVLDELNTKRLTLTTDINAFGVKICVKPDYKLLGRRLKEKLKIISCEMELMTNAEIYEGMSAGFFQCFGEKIYTTEIKVNYKVSESQRNVKMMGDRDLLVLINLTESERLQREGIARDIINRVQKLKKKAHLLPTDEVAISYYIKHDSPSLLIPIIQEFRTLIETTIKSSFNISTDPVEAADAVLTNESFYIEGEELTISIARIEKIISSDFEFNANVYLHDDVKERYSSSRSGVVKLKHSTGEFLSIDDFRNEIDILFGLYGMNIVMKCDEKIVQNVEDLVSKNVYIHNNF